jgi:hypothetical protein
LPLACRIRLPRLSGSTRLLINIRLIASPLFFQPHFLSPFSHFSSPLFFQPRFLSPFSFFSSPLLLHHHTDRSGSGTLVFSKPVCCNCKRVSRVVGKKRRKKEAEKRGGKRGGKKRGKEEKKRGGKKRGKSRGNTLDRGRKEKSLSKRIDALTGHDPHKSAGDASHPSSHTVRCCPRKNLSNMMRNEKKTKKSGEWKR